MKKKLSVPYIPHLDTMPMESISDELEEQSTRQSIECINWPDKFAYRPITVFNLARGDKYLYIDYFVRGNYLRAVNYKDNDPVWQDSCVEFFVQVPGEKEYYNFEFNCIGTALGGKRENRNAAVHLSPECLKSIKRYASAGNKPFQEMEGLFAWNLLVAIPFELIGLDGNNLPEKLYANFYKCADGTSLPHYLSWSPIETEKPDFHRPDFFGEIYF